jgi:hypothetical protein
VPQKIKSFRENKKKSVFKYTFLKNREFYEMVARNTRVRSNVLNICCHVESILLTDRKETLKKKYIIIFSKTYETSEIAVLIKCHCDFLSCDVRVVYSAMREGSLLSGCTVFILCGVCQAVPWLRQLVAKLSLRSPDLISVLFV